VTIVKVKKGSVCLKGPYTIYQSDEDLIQSSIDLRRERRSERRFQLADEIRETLREAGVELRDASTSTSWWWTDSVISSQEGFYGSGAEIWSLSESSKEKLRQLIGGRHGGVR